MNDGNDTGLPARPMPMDRGAVADAFREAMQTLRTAITVDQAVDAICGNDMRLASEHPLASARALATTWLDQTKWRRDDPRAGVLLVTATGKEAAMLRNAGFEATTAFAHARGREPRGCGLVIGIGMADVEMEHVRHLIDVPPHVRIVLIEDVETLKRVLPPIRPEQGVL